MVGLWMDSRAAAHVDVGAMGGKKTKMWVRGCPTLWS